LALVKIKLFRRTFLGIESFLALEMFDHTLIFDATINCAIVLNGFTDYSEELFLIKFHELQGDAMKVEEVNWTTPGENCYSMMQMMVQISILILIFALLYLKKVGEFKSNACLRGLICVRFIFEYRNHGETKWKLF
jgi:hypothetical protein